MTGIIRKAAVVWGLLGKNLGASHINFLLAGLQTVGKNRTTTHVHCTKN